MERDEWSETTQRGQVAGDDTVEARARGDTGWAHGPRRFGVADGARTHDNWNHNPGLYQLSYSHHGISESRNSNMVCFRFRAWCFPIASALLCCASRAMRARLASAALTAFRTDVPW
jgi:hypothetical protein